MTPFTLVGNQHGTLVTTAVAADNVTPKTVSNRAAVSSDETILKVVPNLGFPEQFAVTTQGKAGVATITVSGINAAAVPFSTVFTFDVSAVPVDEAVAFTATLINVANN